jgi:hypothetical protein
MSVDAPVDPVDPVESRIASARRRGRRAGLAVVMVIAVAFIGSSLFQLTRAVFDGRTVQEMAARPPADADPACAEGVRRLAAELDEAPRAVPAPPVPPFGGNVAAVEAACARSAGGLDLWAALQRAGRARAQTQGSRRDSLETIPSGRAAGEVRAHGPADLR